MPPPRGSWNPLEGPGDYDVTPTVHNDTYRAIDPVQLNLGGRAVLIVGASRGIGRAMSVSFAKSGASKIAIAARSMPSETCLEMLAATADLPIPQPSILPIQMEVTDQASIASAVEVVRAEFGHLDIMVINAGVLTKGRIIDSSPEDWARNWTVNVMGPYLLARAFLPLMLAGGEKTIVTVSSVGAHIVLPGFSGYEMSKLGVLRLTEFLAAEHGDDGLVAYSIHPGNVPTDMVGGPEGVDPEMRHGEFGMDCGSAQT
ncbi:hypothetical protein LRP88_11727 [Fusarium phalaenopsidis]